MSLPNRPSFDRLRRLARAFQRACLAGDGDAARRLAAVFPEADPRALALTTAQTVIARDHGFPGWPALKAAIDAPSAPKKPKSAADLDAEALAARLLGLAETGDLGALGRALAIGKQRRDAARAVMQRSADRYAAFQAVLVGGLTSRRDRTRFECAAALDQFGDTSTREPLARLMDDPVPRVRWMAMHALSCHACGDKAGPLEPHIRDRIAAAAERDPSVHVRRHAAMALTLAREASAAPVLRDMLERETDARLRRSVEWALGELSRPAKPVPAGV